MYNKKLINQLTILLKYSDLQGSDFKSRAYSNMIKLVESVKYDITPVTVNRFKEEYKGQITQGMSKRIEEYIKSGSLSGLDEAEKYIMDSEFVIKIAGVGPKLAQKFVDAGYTNKRAIHLAVESGKLKLTRMQELGLKYYDDINSRIPRDEISRIFSKLRKYIPKVSIITGSYRRGAADSGDIDILCRIDELRMESIYESIVQMPEYVDTFSRGDERFTFLYRGPSGKVRQIDVLLLRPEEYWTGILYFTGSADFNVAMRGYAKTIGYRLNQRSLCKLPNSAPLHIESEKQIFDILGLTYIDPEYRISANNIILV